MQLPVVVPHGFDVVDTVCLRDKSHTLHTKPITAHGDRQGVVGMALGQLQQLLPGSLGDIAAGLHYLNGKLFPQPAHQGLAHDTHKGCVPGRFPASLFEFVVGEPPSVESLMALVTVPIYSRVTERTPGSIRRLARGAEGSQSGLSQAPDFSRGVTDYHVAFVTTPPLMDRGGGSP